MDNTKVRGKDITVYISGAVTGTYPIGCDEMADIEFTTSTIAITSKCSKDPITGIIWDEITPSINSWKVTGQGLIPMLATAGYDEVSAQQLAIAQFKQTLVYVTWGIAGTNLFFGGNAYLTTVKATGDYKDVSRYNYVLMGTGPVQTYAVS